MSSSDHHNHRYNTNGGSGRSSSQTHSAQSSQGTGAGVRVKRKPPPTFPYSSKYPSPDPDDPFAPLAVLRQRAQTSSTNLVASPQTNASMNNSGHGPSSSFSSPYGYTSTPESTPFYGHGQPSQQQSRYLMTPDHPPIAHSTPRNQQDRRPWFELAAGYISDSISHSQKPLRPPPRSRTRPPPTAVVGGNRNSNAYFSDADVSVNVAASRTHRNQRGFDTFSPSVPEYSQPQVTSKLTEPPQQKEQPPPPPPPHQYSSQPSSIATVRAPVRQQTAPTPVVSAPETTSVRPREHATPKDDAEHRYRRRSRSVLVLSNPDPYPGSSPPQPSVIQKVSPTPTSTALPHVPSGEPSQQRKERSQINHRRTRSPPRGDYDRRQYTYDDRQSHGYQYNEYDFEFQDGWREGDARGRRGVGRRDTGSSGSNSSERSRHPTPPMTPDDSLSTTSTSPMDRSLHGNVTRPARRSPSPPPVIFQEPIKPPPVPKSNDDRNFRSRPPRVIPPSRLHVDDSAVMISDTPATIHTADFPLLLAPMNNDDMHGNTQDHHDHSMGDSRFSSPMQDLERLRPATSFGSSFSHSHGVRAAHTASSSNPIVSRHTESEPETMPMDVVRRTRTTSLSSITKRLRKTSASLAGGGSGVRGRKISNPSNPTLVAGFSNVMANVMRKPSFTSEYSISVGHSDEAQPAAVAAPAARGPPPSRHEVTSQPASTAKKPTPGQSLQVPRPKKSLSTVNLGLKPLPNVSMGPSIAPSTNLSLANDVAGVTPLNPSLALMSARQKAEEEEMKRHRQVGSPDDVVVIRPLDASASSSPLQANPVASPAGRSQPNGYRKPEPPVKSSLAHMRRAEYTDSDNESDDPAYTVLMALRGLTPAPPLRLLFDTPGPSESYLSPQRTSFEASQRVIAPPPSPPRPVQKLKKRRTDSPVHDAVVQTQIEPVVDTRTMTSAVNVKPASKRAETAPFPYKGPGPLPLSPPARPHSPVVHAPLPPRAKSPTPLQHERHSVIENKIQQYPEDSEGSTADVDELGYLPVAQLRSKPPSRQTTADASTSTSSRRRPSVQSQGTTQSLSSVQSYTSSSARGQPRTRPKSPDPVPSAHTSSRTRPQSPDPSPPPHNPIVPRPQSPEYELPRTRPQSPDPPSSSSRVQRERERTKSPEPSVPSNRVNRERPMSPDPSPPRPQRRERPKSPEPDHPVYEQRRSPSPLEEASPQPPPKSRPRSPDPVKALATRNGDAELENHVPSQRDDANVSPVVRRQRTAPPTPAMALNSPVPTTQSAPYHSPHSQSPGHKRARKGDAFSPMIFDEHARLNKEQVARAANLDVIAQNGIRIPFADLIRDRKTIVIVVRHFWCGMDQDYMYSVSKQVDTEVLRRAGVDLIIIGHGSPGMIRSYKQIWRTPFPIYTDPSLRLHAALGLTLRTNDPGPDYERGEYIRHGMVGAIAMVVRNALRVGMPVWEKSGDVSQLGGEFIFDPGYNCSFAHRMVNTRSHAPIHEVISAAGVQIFKEYSRSGSNEEEDMWEQPQTRHSNKTRYRRHQRKENFNERWATEDGLEDSDSASVTINGSWAHGFEQGRRHAANEHYEDEGWSGNRNRIHRSRRNNETSHTSNPSDGSNARAPRRDKWQKENHRGLNHGRSVDESYNLTHDVLARSFGRS